MMKVFTVDQKIGLLQRLDKISPRWTKHLSVFDNSYKMNRPEEGLNILSCNHCIVGEGHNGVLYTNRLFPNYCEICREYSFQLANITMQVYDERGRDIVNSAWVYLEKFIDHFEEVHMEKIKIVLEIGGIKK